jgi:thiamine-phosphate pyrophosphorylase
MRDVKGDVGAGRSTKSEGRRKNILDVFIANIKRAEESIRVFEELSKLFNAKLGPKFKKIRFELYDIEQDAALKLKKKIKLDFNLYVITNPSFGRSHLEIMKAAAKSFDYAQDKGGVLAVQLRDKNMSKSEYLKTAKAMSKYAKARGLTFIVNDNIDIAKRSDSDGVHIGRPSHIPAARKILGEGKIIGASAYNLVEAVRSERLGADYIGFGPVFDTPIKPGMKSLGIKALQRVMNRVTIPVVAIGGINKANIGQIRAAGCDKAAVIRAVSAAPDVTRAVRDLIRLLSCHRQV